MDPTEKEAPVSQPSGEKRPRSDVVREFGLDDQFIEEAVGILDNEKKSVPPFWIKKYETEAVKNWNLFYKRNKANFFKDRHYLQNEFEDLQESDNSLTGLGDKVLVELGCGVGNAIVPLLHANPSLKVVATDCSSEAIGLLNQRLTEEPVADRCTTAVVDATSGVWPEDVPQQVDMCLILFALSAVGPEKHKEVASLAFRILKPGGTLLFRDYGRYDLAQLRFAQNKGQPAKLADNFYVRADGTRAYYFTCEELNELFTQVGFEELENKFHCRIVTNRKQQKDMKRVWIQAQFRKP